MEILIQLLPNGQLGFQMRGGNLLLALGALEKIKAELLKKADEPPQTIEPAPASLLSRLNGR